MTTALGKDRAAGQRHSRFLVPLLPWRGWKRILWNTYSAISADHLSLLGAAIAFYMLFALFPALAAATSIFGLVYNPETLRQQIEPLGKVFPKEAWNLIEQQLIALTSHGGGTLSVATIIAVVVALYSARLAASAMMEALNVVYKVKETRSFIQANLIALVFTLVAIVVVLLAIGLIIVAPIIFSVLGLASIAGTVIDYIRWPALFILVVFGLAVTYRFGPNRKDAYWRWITWGSITATVIWLVVSIGFSWYVQEFSSYNKVYGSIGAVIILLFWFWLTAFSALLGAELDKHIEDEMAKDAVEKP